MTPVRVTTSFKKLYAKKPAAMQRAIDGAVTQLRTDWRHNSLRTHRVWGRRGVWEARIDGGNRLTFHWDGNTIVLRTHCNHDVLNKP